MAKHNFRRLKIHQRALAFVVEIYKISKRFPEEEVYGLTSQIRRAATLVALNIAEGSGNFSEKEFKRYWEIALRSDYEVIACLEIALRLNYCSSDDCDRLISEADEISAMISVFSQSLVCSLSVC